MKQFCFERHTRPLALVAFTPMPCIASQGGQPIVADAAEGTRAYLALNDVRGQSLDSQALRRQLDQALREKSELARSHQSLEFDNLNKEKKISKMTRELHELKVQPSSVKQA